jgi:hypothetical protein
LKGRIGFEKFSVRNYERMKHLVLLAMIAMGFCVLFNAIVYWVKGIFSFTSKFRKKSFEYYRLLDGLQNFVYELTKTAGILVKKKGTRV